MEAKLQSLFALRRSVSAIGESKIPPRNLDSTARGERECEFVLYVEVIELSREPVFEGEGANAPAQRF